MIYLVRHTRPDIDLNICYGQTDMGLADTFEHEVEKVQLEINGIFFEKIYASPLKRSRILAGKLFGSKNVIFDTRLMEMNFGTFEGMYWDEVYKTEGANEWFNDWVNIPCPKGESFRDVIKRVEDFVADRNISIDQNICIVTHGGVLGAFEVIYNKMDPKKVFDLKIEFGEIRIIKG